MIKKLRRDPPDHPAVALVEIEPARDTVPGVILPAGQKFIWKIFRRLHYHRSIADPRLMRSEPAQGHTEDPFNFLFGICSGSDQLDLLPGDQKLLRRLSDCSFLRGLVFLDPSTRKADLASLPDPRLADLKKDAELPAGLHQRDQDRVLSFYGTDLFQCPSGSFTSDLLHLYHLFCRP